MPDEAKPPRRGALVLGFLLVVLVHCAGIAYFAPPRVLLGSEPPVVDAHGITAVRILEDAFSQPGGLIGWIAHRLRHYGALVLALHFAVPLVGMAAARRARASPGATLVAGALYSALWWLDSVTHWCWYSGRVGWLVAGLAVPFVLAEASRGVRRFGFFVALAALGAALLPLAEPVGAVFSSRTSLLAYDLLDVLSDGYGAEGNVRAAVRVLVWTAAGFVLYERGRSDAGARVFGGFACTAAVLAYLGGYLPIAWPVDPYLLVVPATFAMALPAAELFASAASPSSIRQVEPTARVLVVLALLVATPRLARTVLSYVPQGMPERVVRNPGDLRVSAMVGPNERTPDPQRHAPPPPSYASIAHRLAAAVPAGTIFVRDRALAAYLKTHTEVPIFGPLAVRGEGDPQAEASRAARWRGPALRETLKRHAIKWVLAEGLTDPLERRGDVLEPAASLDAARLYRVREPLR